MKKNISCDRRKIVIFEFEYTTSNAALMFFEFTMQFNQDVLYIKSNLLSLYFMHFFIIPKNSTVQYTYM